MARWIPRGAALGVEDETPKVETAIEKMGSPDSMGAGGSVEVKGSRGGDTYYFSLTVQANTRADAEAIGEVVEQKVVEMFSRRRTAKGV